MATQIPCQTVGLTPTFYPEYFLLGLSSLCPLTTVISLLIRCVSPSQPKV